MITFGGASGVERERGILRDLVEVWDVGDMNSFESHHLIFFRERKQKQQGNTAGIQKAIERERERERVFEL